jgi:uncharacterized membrane protein YidH (DUF202 family)
MSANDLFDSGLQPERTDLAWRRTALALTVGALVAGRLLLSVLGLWSSVVGAAGIGAAASIWIGAVRRARRTRSMLLGSSGTLPDARLLLFRSVVVPVGAALGILYVLLRTR